MVKIFAAAIMTLASVIAFTAAAPTIIEKRGVVTGSQFDHFFIIVLENTDYTTAIADPYMLSLSKRGTLLTNYDAITHPSQPNYIAMISGSTQGFLDDNTHNYAAKNIVDILEPKGVTWKAYQENFPSACYLKDSSDKLYRRKHDPFISFTNINGNATRCANIVSSTQLATDITNNALPGFSFYTPNMNNDGHDTSMSYASNWLKGFIEPLLLKPNFTTRTAILITFDEDDTQVASNKNRVYALLLGGAITSAAGTQDATAYNHYSILATVEKNWALGNLGQADVGATPLKI